MHTKPMQVTKRLGTADIKILAMVGQHHDCVFIIAQLYVHYHTTVYPLTHTLRIHHQLPVMHADAFHCHALSAMPMTAVCRVHRGMRSALGMWAGDHLAVLRIKQRQQQRQQQQQSKRAFPDPACCACNKCSSSHGIALLTCCHWLMQLVYLVAGGRSMCGDSQTFSCRLLVCHVQTCANALHG